MSWEEQEPESFNCFGLEFRCRRAQQREILRRMKSLPAWREWHTLDSVMRTQHVYSDNVALFRTQLEEARRTAEALARAEAALTEAVLRVIDEVLAAA